MCLGLRMVQHLGFLLAIFFTSGVVFAQDEGHIRDLRNQLQRNQVSAEEDSSGFVADDKELMEAESALMRELGQKSNNMAQKEAPAEALQMKDGMDVRAAADLEAAIEAERQALERLKDGKMAQPETPGGGMIHPVNTYDAPTENNTIRETNISKEQSHSQTSVSDTASLAKENTDLSDKLKSQEKSLSHLRKDSMSLKGKLANRNAELRKLQDELNETRNKLIIAEAEVQQLTRLLKKRDASNMARFGVQSSSSAPAAPRRDVEEMKSRRFVPSTRVNEYEKKVTPEMRIATVVVPKANLRTGPGLNNSPLMTVIRGTRLAVEIRKGEWYRVVTPTGARAWVSGEVIEFGAGLKESPMRTRRSTAYESGIEQEAHELYKRKSE